MSGCERTWPSDRPTRLDDTYRQHRCGQPAGHDGRCTLPVLRRCAVSISVKQAKRLAALSAWQAEHPDEVLS